MGFALIIAMMIAMSGIITGFSAQIFGITARAGESPSIYIQTQVPNVGIPSKILSKINHPNILHVLPIVEREINMTTTKGAFRPLVVGVNLSHLLEYYAKSEVYTGRLPRSNDSSIIECLAGKDIQALLGSSVINITDNTLGIDQQIHVTGLIQGIKEFQSSILLDFNTYQMLLENNGTSDQVRYQRIKINLKNGVFVKDTINDLYDLLYDDSIALVIKPEQQADIFTESLFQDVLSKLNLLYGVLFLIALIRAFHGVSWFVKKYERDLLIMRATGLSATQTFSLVIFLAEIIGLAGFFMGLFLGVLIPSILFTLLTLFFKGGFFAPEYTTEIIVPLFLLSNLVSIIAAIYPAGVIARRSPSALSLSTHGLDR